MPLRINPADYGQSDAKNLAVVMGSISGEVRPTAGLENRAMIVDVGANRASGQMGSFGKSPGLEGGGLNGIAAYLRNPNEFSTWRESEANAYRNATKMRDTVLAIVQDPNAFDRLPPAYQKEVLANLTAVRGVAGSGELRGISGASTFYSVPALLRAARSAEHRARGSDYGIESGGNVFYGNNPVHSKAVSAAVEEFRRGNAPGAYKALATNMPAGTAYTESLGSPKTPYIGGPNSTPKDRVEFVTAAFKHALNRQPDRGELINWTQQIKNGVPPEDIVRMLQTGTSDFARYDPNNFPSNWQINPETGISPEYQNFLDRYNAAPPPSSGSPEYQNFLDRFNNAPPSTGYVGGSFGSDPGGGPGSDILGRLWKGDFSGSSENDALVNERGFIWNPEAYLQANPDVRAAGLDPAYHASKFGGQEGRLGGWDVGEIPRFLQGWGGGQDSPYQSWVAQGSTAPVFAKDQFDFAKFNPSQYLIDNPDVAAANVDPAAHAARFGAAEGRLSGIDPASIPRFLQGWGGAQDPGYQDWINAPGSMGNFNERYSNAPPSATGGVSMDSFNARWNNAPPGTGPGAFDPGRYLIENPDVGVAGIDPAYHYTRFGRPEGRSPELDPASVPGFLRGWGGAQPPGYQDWINPSVSMDQFNQRWSNAPPSTGGVPMANFNDRFNAAPPGGARTPFDPGRYILENPDVGVAGIDPAYHYTRYGAPEGRSPEFDPASVPRFLTGWGGAQPPGYQDWINPSVSMDQFNQRWNNAPPAPSGVSMANFNDRFNAAPPAAGSLPFDPGRYLIENPDVGQAGIDPAYHYTRFGRPEGRSPEFNPASVPRFLTGWGGAQPPGYLSWITGQPFLGPDDLGNNQQWAGPPRAPNGGPGTDAGMETNALLNQIGQLNQNVQASAAVERQLAGPQGIPIPVYAQNSFLPGAPQQTAVNQNAYLNQVNNSLTGLAPVAPPSSSFLPQQHSFGGGGGGLFFSGGF